MTDIIQSLQLWIASVRYWPITRLYARSEAMKLINEDVNRWNKELGWLSSKNPKKSLIRLLYFRPQFRNLVFYRLKIHSTTLKRLCPPDPSLFIADDCTDIVGGAIYFEHSFSTIFEVAHIGYGCTFRQVSTFGVKTGVRHSERPWIGENVDFGANVTCIGAINIGNNSIIGAGSVIVKDVPPNTIVVGNPARVIKQIRY